MISLAVTTKEKNLVLNAAGGVLIEPLYLMVKAFPLGVFVGVFKMAISWICAIDKAEIHSCLKKPY